MIARQRFFAVAGVLLPAVAWLACGGSEPGASTPTSFDHFVATGSYQGEYWPTADWRTCRPEDVGMDSASLYTAYEYAARSSFVTEGILVVRRGYVVGEEYFRGYGPTTRFSSYSVAKSFLSAVVGVAIFSVSRRSRSPGRGGTTRAGTPSSCPGSSTPRPAGPCSTSAANTCSTGSGFAP